VKEIAAGHLLDLNAVEALCEIIMSFREANNQDSDDDDAVTGVKAVIGSTLALGNLVRS
jgi:hypothetical protein